MLHDAEHTFLAQTTGPSVNQYGYTHRRNSIITVILVVI